MPTGRVPVIEFTQPIDGDTQAVIATSSCCFVNGMHIKAYSTWWFGDNAFHFPAVAAAAVAWVITQLGWHPDVWGRTASFVHLWISPRGRRGALINGWWNAGPLWWHARSPVPSLRVSHSGSLTHLPSAEQEAGQDSGKKPACVYHPLNAHNMESSACHLNAL